MSTATLKVAIVGSGPAGMYVADALLFDAQEAVAVDVFDRLPTPFGLLRYGVAPDHLKMKSLAVGLQRTLEDPRLRFFGGVAVGTDISVDELRRRYHAVFYAFGASADRQLGVPGEELAGSKSATQFVSWYSGHPDVDTSEISLSAETAVVVGMGNVAVDVARILLKQPAALAQTDMPSPVLDQLRSSSIQDVHILGRRGPEHASWTHKELRELGEVDGVDVIIDTPEALDSLDSGLEERSGVQRNLTTLIEWRNRTPKNANRRLHLHFWSRPVELRGGAGLESVTVERTQVDGDGRLAGTGTRYELPAQLLVRSVGYRGLPLSGVPFDHVLGTIPSDKGRVLREGHVSPGEYAVGWIGRGPVGVLGTNRADADDVVALLRADRDQVIAHPCHEMQDVHELLLKRGVRLVTRAGWAAINAEETRLGLASGRPRAKLSSYDELFQAAAARTEVLT